MNVDFSGSKNYVYAKVWALCLLNSCLDGEEEKVAEADRFLEKFKARFPLEDDGGGGDRDEEYEGRGSGFLRDCPFCGSGQVDVMDMELKKFRVICDECETFGPERSSPAEAIESWNRRA